MFNFKQFMFDKSLTQNHLSKIMGESQSVVSLLANGHRKPLKKHLDALAAEFGAETIEKYILPDDAYAPRRTTATIVPYEVVEEVREELRREGCPDCKAAIPYVSKDLAQSREVDIKELVLQGSPELQRKLIHEFFGGINYIQRVITSAMMPLFQPGDLLFVKFLPDDVKLISGAIYLLDTSAYGTMVRQVYVDGDVFRLHSLNPEYEELTVHRNEIFSISLVEKSLRSDFNMPSAMPNVVELMSSRDKQIDSLIEQIDKAGERESRLISIIENKNK